MMETNTFKEPEPLKFILKKQKHVDINDLPKDTPLYPKGISYRSEEGIKFLFDNHFTIIPELYDKKVVKSWNELCKKGLIKIIIEEKFTISGIELSTKVMKLKCAINNYNDVKTTSKRRRVSDEGFNSN
uniref:CSON008683 protein n=1 Tax=Culicoides sonorensis TaxID=179676 RepID=A0A336MX68_CULSO